MPGIPVKTRRPLTVLALVVVGGPCVLATACAATGETRGATSAAAPSRHAAKHANPVAITLMNRAAQAAQAREYPEGVLGVTTTLVSLLARHYVLTYAGTSSAGNRMVQEVDAWRQDDSLAAQFFLDRVTGLPLERAVFDPAGNLISTASLASEPVGAEQARRARIWTAPVAPERLPSQARTGWLAPPQLPAGLTLFAGSQALTTAGPVLDLTYSDGLYIVSVFEQHGKLAPLPNSWHKAQIGRTVVYARADAYMPSQRELTWPGQGIVYTLIADAPAQVIADVVAALPHDRPPGFWRRVTRGLARLADLVNPF